MALLRAAACSLVWSALALAAMSHGWAQGPARPEYQIKAVFLFNFTLFTQWPAEAFADDTAPIVLGVVGDDPLGSYLDEAVRGEKVDKRPVLVRRARHLENLPPCHLLFVSQSEAARLPQVLAQIRGRPTLTVSEIEGFAQQGGMIQFLREGGKVRLRINPASAKASGLTLSSTLLRSAEIISAEAP